MVMESVLDYLASEHQSILDRGYRWRGCLSIAKEVAKRLITEGKTPYVRLVYEEVETDGGEIKPKALVPRLKGTSIDPFYAHWVCCDDGDKENAYDPLLGYPVPVGDYCRALFGEDIQMRVDLDVSIEIRKSINRDLNNEVF
jgi:hypothetical protein